MRTLLALLALVSLAFVAPAMAAKKGAPQGGPELKIIDVDAVSVTVSVGLSGNEHFTYKITDNTKVTLNGAPIFARDLRAGMVARFTLSPDHETAISIEAKDPPAHPGRRRVG
jgi:hypothetical protein